MENTFKSSVFGGFNRDDVIRYIEKTSLESKQHRSVKKKNLTRAVFGQPLFFRHFAAKKLKVYIITCCHRVRFAL